MPLIFSAQKDLQITHILSTMEEKMCSLFGLDPYVLSAAEIHRVCLSDQYHLFWIVTFFPVSDCKKRRKKNSNAAHNCPLEDKNSTILQYSGSLYCGGTTKIRKGK